MPALNAARKCKRGGPVFTIGSKFLAFCMAMVTVLVMARIGGNEKGNQ